MGKRGIPVWINDSWEAGPELTDNMLAQSKRSGLDQYVAARVDGTRGGEAPESERSVSLGFPKDYADLIANEHYGQLEATYTSVEGALRRISRRRARIRTDGMEVRRSTVPMSAMVDASFLV